MNEKDTISPIDTALHAIEELFENAQVPLHEIESDTFEVDSVHMCENGNLRIILRRCSECQGSWLELECGFVHPQWEERTQDSICLLFTQEVESDGWMMRHADTPKAHELLIAIDPTLDEVCPAENLDEHAQQRSQERLTQRIGEQARRQPNSEFALDVAAKMISHLCVNGVPPGTTHMDVPNPPVI